MNAGNLYKLDKAITTLTDSGELTNINSCFKAAPSDVYFFYQRIY
jgi:hypothetical protein